MDKYRDRSQDVEAFEVAFPPHYTKGLNQEVSGTTVKNMYEDSYGEKGKGWFPRFSKVALGGAAIVAIVVTAEGVRHFRNKYPDESID